VIGDVRDVADGKRLIVRSWAQFPAFLVMKEQRHPWCSDRTSITKAGWNGAKR
jgi:hypothetical protein